VTAAGSWVLAAIEAGCQRHIQQPFLQLLAPPSLRFQVPAV